MSAAGERVTVKAVADSLGYNTSLVHYYFGTRLGFLRAAGLAECEHCGGTGYCAARPGPVA